MRIAVVFPAVSSLDLSIGERFELVSAIDEYVFGFCQHERLNSPAGDEAPPDPELDAMRDYIDALLTTGDYPALSAIADEPGLEGAWTEMQRQMADPGRFQRNLTRLLDGFEAELRRRPSRRARRG